MTKSTVRKDRLRLVRELEDAATPEERLEGLTLAYAGAVGQVFEEESEGKTGLSAEVASEGQYHRAEVSMGSDGGAFECGCGMKTPCRHVIALARASVKEDRRIPPHSQPRWRILMEKMAPARMARVPMDGEEIFVHWINAVPYEGKNHLLTISWRIHRAGKRGIGRGEPVSPDRIKTDAAKRLSEADRQAVEAVGRGFARPGIPVVKNAVLAHPSDIDRILRALSRANFVYWEETRERVSFDPSPVIPRITAGEEGDRLKITGEWAMLDGTAYRPVMPRIFAGINPWMEDQGILRPVFGTADGAAAQTIIEQGAIIGPSDIPVFLGTALPGLIGSGTLVKVAAGLPQGGGDGKSSPRPRLYLSEEDGMLVASLRFKYGEYEIASENPDPVLLLPLADGGKVRVQREMEEELWAVKRLASMGFTPTDDGRFAISGEKALDFIRAGLHELASDWDLFGREDLKRHRVRQKELTLSVRISAENDWLDLWADASAGGDPVEIDRILKALKKGSRYIKLSDQSHVFIADKWAGKLGELLADAHLGAGESRLNPYMASVAEELAENADEVRIEKPSGWKKIKSLIEGAPRLAREKAPRALKCRLRPYQEKGYRWLRHLERNALGGILADDMGLGKTVQALALLLKEKENGSPGPSLVVSPTSVVHNWEDEITRHAPMLKCIRYMGQDREKLVEGFTGADVILTSYAILRRDKESLAGVQFNYVILDEAQAIKNAATQTARAATTLNARRKLALTGTPLENHLGELWSHMHFLMPGLLGSQKAFVKRYERPIIKGDRDALEELKKRVRPFMLRRMKSEVAPELPPKVENILWSEFGPIQAELYAKILQAGRERVYRAADGLGVVGARPQILDLLLRLRQTACHPAVLPDMLGQGVPSAKFEQFTEFVSEVIEEGNRVLVYSQFVQVLKILKNWFETAGIPHLYMDGRTRDRETVVKKFQEDSQFPAFLVSLKAGGTGLNLTGADYVILFDPWWNPAIENQAADRAHRIGREGTVFFYRMVARGSVEEKIMKLKERKRELTDGVILSEHQWGLPSTIEELRELFED